MTDMVRTRVERRAAFDIGSGSSKMQISDVEISSSQETAVIISTLFGQERPVSFGADFIKSIDGTLSDSIQEYGLTVIQNLKDEALRQGCTSFSAVATEVFRKATNGNQYLDKVRALGILSFIVLYCISEGFRLE